MPEVSVRYQRLFYDVTKTVCTAERSELFSVLGEIHRRVINTGAFSDHSWTDSVIYSAQLQLQRPNAYIDHCKNDLHGQKAAFHGVLPVFPRLLAWKVI